MSDSRPAALSAVAFGRGSGAAVKSPTKSPARAPASAVTRISVDDVSYRQTDSSRAADQARLPDAATGEPHQGSEAASAASSAEKQSKYMHLLSAMYNQHPSSKAHSPAAGPSASRAHGGAPLAPADDLAAAAAAAALGATPPVRMSSGSPQDGAGVLSKGSSTTPTVRRSKASILDSSPASSLIPGSLDAAAAAAASNGRPHGLMPVAGTGGRGVAAGHMPGSPTPAYGMRNSLGASSTNSRILAAREPAPPMRRSAPTAQPRPHYAFGSRVEPPAAAAAKARPSRIGPPAATAAAGGSPISLAQQQQGYGMRAAASPQRVPPAARVSAPTGGASAAYMRSASAPRMSSAEKAQSRFTQHALSAAAAQRSKTPNPAQRAAAAAAAAASASSSNAAARRLRHSAQPQAAGSDRHVARMKPAEAVAPAQHTRLPGFGFGSSSGGLRSPTKAPAGVLGGPPSPIPRAGARSVQAAGIDARGAAAGSRAIAGPPGGRSSNRPSGHRVERLGLSLPAAASGSSSQDSASGVGLMMPVIRDRYKDLYKHTPASIAVQEAQAAAAAATAPAEHSKPRGPGIAGAVPKLSLAGLGRQGSEDALAAPRGPSQQQQQAAADESGSAFLGRMSGLAAAPAGDQGASSITRHQQQQQGSFATPQAQRKPAVPLLALSTITPAARTRPAASAAGESSPYTPATGSAAGDEARSSDIDLTPCPGSAPDADETPSLLMKQQPRTGSSSKAGSRTDAADEASSPQLAPRDLSSGMTAAAVAEAAPAAVAQGAQQGASSSGGGTLSREGSGGAAAAAKGLLLPALQLPGAGAAASPGDSFDSPPKHRRGERESPTGSAETVKTRAHNVCQPGSGGSHSYGRSAATPPARAPAAAVAAARSGPSSASKASAQAAKTRQRVAAAAVGGSSVLQAAAEAGSRDKQGGLRGSLARSLPSPGASTPVHAGTRPKLDGALGSSGPGKGLALPSPSKKLGTPVPRLDLTPVLASMAADQGSPSSDPGSHSHAGPLLLEDAPKPRRLDMDAEADDDGETGPAHSGQRQSSGKAQGGPGSANGTSGSGKSHGLSSKKRDEPSSQSGAEAAAQQESFYVYESVMPSEEQRTYEELRRVLLRAPGGAKHAAHLQGIWGCYQDARRNTEAMAFRGHRLLDQVSTEYSHFKREAEERVEQLQEERDQAREELQLAMVAGSVPATALQLAAKDRQLAEVQEENSLLRQQIAEMERALQMASEYHAATQAAHKEQQVPVHARVIAGSATTSILTNQVVAQQYELQQVEKRMEDMKAALHLACGVLRQTNYMDTHGGLRDQLDPDTQAVLDSIMATEEMEAAALQQQQQHMMQEEGEGLASTQQPASPTVHIEEVQEGDDGC